MLHVRVIKVDFNYLKKRVKILNWGRVKNGERMSGKSQENESDIKFVHICSVGT